MKTVEDKAGAAVGELTSLEADTNQVQSYDNRNANNVSLTGA